MPADELAATWTCAKCNYMNAGPICTHCGNVPATDELAAPTGDLDENANLCDLFVGMVDLNGWCEVRKRHLVAFAKTFRAALAQARADRVELTAARAENDSLRMMAAKIMPCHYCGVDEIAKCPQGFPGCALADDMMAGEISLGEALRVSRSEAGELAGALVAVREHVYCQNDYTTRDYDKYHAAVEQMNQALARYRAAHPEPDHARTPGEQP